MSHDEHVSLVGHFDGDRSTGRGCTTRRAVLVSIGAIVIVGIVLGLGLGLGLGNKPKPKVQPTNPAVGLEAWASTWNIDNVRTHLTTFESWGTRAVGTPGSQTSITYLTNFLHTLPCTISSQEFQVPVFNQTAAPTLSFNSTAGPLTLRNSLDFVQAEYGGSGVHSLDNVLLHVVNTDGCTTADWAGFPAGQVAAIQSDVFSTVCSNFQRAAMAQSAGAKALLFRMDEIFSVPVGIGMQDWPWFEGMPTGTDIPVFFVAQTLGAMILNSEPGDYKITLTSSSVTVNATVYNVMCDTAGDEKTTILIGAHYDSVPAGPGVNDNGSGSSTLMELVRAFYQVFGTTTPKNRVRFAWWAAEEMGLLGSLHYAKIAHTTGLLQNCSFAINMDMLGSPNGFPQIHSISESEPSPMFNITDQMAPIMNKFQALLENEYKASNIPYELIAFEANSDYWPFLYYGIPAGGFATGAGEKKTAAEQVIFKGLQNVAMDPCYHQNCDRVSSINLDLVSQMGKAMAGALSHMVNADGVGLQ